MLHFVIFKCSYDYKLYSECHTYCLVNFRQTNVNSYNSILSDLFSLHELCKLLIYFLCVRMSITLIFKQYGKCCTHFICRAVGQFRFPSHISSSPVFS